MPLTMPLLLQAWRRSAGLKPSAAARALGLARSTITNWESGLRQPGHGELGRYDDVLGAGGALSDIAFALDSPLALEARRTWWHNCPPGGRPVWAWIRPGPDRTRPTAASAYWGAFRCDASTVGGEGLVLAAESSVTNPPIKVELDPPGWVDFGRSRFPESLGVRQWSVAEHARLHAIETDVRAILPSSVPGASRQRERLVKLVHQLFGEPEDATRAALAALEHDDRHFDDLSDLAPSDAPPRTTALDGAAYARLRCHRRMSRRTVADLVTGLDPGHPVTDDQLLVLERGGRPRTWRLGSRLDTVYRADGQTCLEPVPVRGDDKAGRLVVDVPRYWVGPLWVTFTGPDPVGGASLEWAPWRKDVCIRSGTTVTFRRSEPDQGPIGLRLPKGWGATAGIGAHDRAVDINDGWVVDDERPKAVFADLYSTYLTTFGSTHGQLMELLRAAER